MSQDSAAIVARIDNMAQRVETQCGENTMIWRVWPAQNPTLLPPLVLLHGGSGSWKHWLRNVEFFSRSRQVIAADMPGYGEFAEPAQPVSFASLGKIIGGGIEQIVGAGNIYDIIGFSLGSFMAPWAIKSCRARARSLTLVHGHLVGIMQYSPQDRLKRWRGVENPDERDAILRNNLGALMLANPDAADALTLHVYRSDLDQSRLRVPGFIGTLDTSILKNMDVKLFAVTGDKDPTASPTVAAQHELLRAMRPDVQSHILASCGHWAMWERASDFNELARRILDNVHAS